MGNKTRRRKALHAQRKGPSTPPCFIALGGLWPQRWRLLALCCHTAHLQYHQKGRGHPHGPFCHCGLDPSHLSGPTPWAAAIFVPQSRAGPSSCRPHVTKMVAARTGAWLVGTQVSSQCCCSQPSKLAPRGYQLLRRCGMVGKAVTFPPTQRTEASGPAAHDYGPLTATTPGTIALGGAFEGSKSHGDWLGHSLRQLQREP